MTSLRSGLPKLNLNSTFVDDLKWQLALEYSGIGMWEFDAALNRVYFSEGSKKILGVSDPFFGNDVNAWNNRVHPEDKEKYFQDFQDHLKGLKPMYENEHRVLCDDGSYKWIRDRGRIVEWDEDNAPKRIIGTHTDITTQKQQEQSVNDALIIATEHNNKLKNFAYIVTHNLKQHTANFESLMDFYYESDDPNEKEEIMGHLKTLSQCLTKTIANLNEVVHVQNSKSKEVKKIFIAKEINHILDLLHYVISENNATIHNNISKKLFLYYNNSYFESIIQNLLSNAIKYKHPDRDPVISIDCAYDKQEFKLIISDNGMGIDLEKYGDDIFGLYKTFHHNNDSEGIGLYLIKNQIESFGGRITVDSKVGVGTSFTIYAKNKRV
ncbi:PAS domain-containing protein [Gelidibacter japonicus]|jgi:PAS domain S-box-containing protein|uniref:sensor histidine kinase n=1 Tax=Gelidibacter japonicus TaxID=1962232 RepID=UPI002020D7B4|nr:PAS domain-containing protein [Gelidibacter japonicus]MCL8009257.1 PAS domain-containing protein [Gelidibacter japonicus]